MLFYDTPPQDFKILFRGAWPSKKCAGTNNSRSRKHLFQEIYNFNYYLGSPQSQKVTFGNSLMIDNSTKLILDGFETKHFTG